MIKSLFDDDENGDESVVKPLESNEAVIPDDVENAPAADPESIFVVPFEVESPIGQPAPDPSESELEQSIEEIEADLLGLDLDDSDPLVTGQRPIAIETEEKPRTNIDIAPAAEAVEPIIISQKDVDHSPLTESSSMAETMRKSGLAYSAAIALFGSVVFMLIMGWFADLVLGIAPWGTVIGIVIGALIGFLQLFRITSKIIQPKPSDFDKVSLRSEFPVSDGMDLSGDPAIETESFTSPEGISNSPRETDLDEPGRKE